MHTLLTFVPNRRSLMSLPCPLLRTSAFGFIEDVEPNMCTSLFCVAMI